MYARIEDGQVAEYPLTEYQIKARFSNTSFSADFLASLPEGYVRVAPAGVPAANDLKIITEGKPALQDGEWVQVWIESDKYTPEQAAAFLAQQAEKQKQQLQQDIVDHVQKRLDTFARTRHYDDIKSACGYAGCSVPKFDTEGSYCRDARAETWAKLYEMLDEVKAGTRPVPASFADIEPELPELVWPPAVAM